MIENVKTKATTVIDEGLRQHMMRVYNYMAGGLVATALAAFAVLNTPLIGLFFSIGPAGQVVGLSALGWLALFAPLIMIFAFGWVISRGTPKQAQAAFWAFSALMGISLAPVLIAYTGASITRIFLITAAMFGAMSIYGYTTKKDLTSMGSFLIMGVWGLIIASIVNIFMASPGLYYAISFIAVIVFTGLTAYDTQKIREMYYVGGEESLTQRAIVGALALYMDFINLFLALLRLFGDRR